MLTRTNIIDVLNALGETGFAKVVNNDLFTRSEENCGWQFIGTVEDAEEAKALISEFWA